MKHATGRRSACPISFTLELVGDPWSLLVLRDIVYFGKRTFGEFRASAEGIARNILADRLDRLVSAGVLHKEPFPGDARKHDYRLTERGLDLVPLLLAAAEWGAAHADSTDAPAWWIRYVREHRDEVVAVVKTAVREGDSIFVGDRSAVRRLERDGALGPAEALS